MNLLLVFVASALWAVDAFAVGALSESAETRCELYMGTGSRYYGGERERRADYTVALRVRPLDSGEDRLDYSFVIDGQVTGLTIVLEEEFMGGIRVSTPTRANPTSYLHIGWGMQLEYDAMHREEGEAKKTTILLGYSGQSGNRYTHHILATRRAGAWQLISSGLVTTTDGERLFAWADKLSLVDGSCQGPELPRVELPPEEGRSQPEIELPRVELPPEEGRSQPEIEWPRVELPPEEGRPEIEWPQPCRGLNCRRN